MKEIKKHEHIDGCHVDGAFVYRVLFEFHASTHGAHETNVTRRRQLSADEMYDNYLCLWYKERKNYLYELLQVNASIQITYMYI